MLRIAFFLCVMSAPLFAADQPASLSLVAASVQVKLSAAKGTVSAEVSCNLTVQNDGSAGGTDFAIRSELIPETKDDRFCIQIDGKRRAWESDAGNSFHWTLTTEAGQLVGISWSYTGGTTLLPHLHPLGRRRLLVPLAYLRSFETLPEAISVSISFGDLPPELFGLNDARTIEISHTVGKKLEDFTFEWYASSLADRTSSAIGLRDTFTNKQRTGANRGYTSTLALLADLYSLADNQAALAETCGLLADLEASSGVALTLCGPSTAWRHYVPWRLLQMEALEKAGLDAKPVAGKTQMQERWQAYIAARESARPFDQFDKSSYGNYWDYDWKRTQELYAHALEVIGDNEAAKAVREVEG
ncbi:MAG: hypothetical protein KDB90_05780 [Planctomycetes bacterium]|nr:hypothetical protein [Planctomycetota bacterium]